MEHITRLADYFEQATQDVTTQSVEDFMTAFLREHQHLLVFSTKQITEQMWQEWLASLPSEQLYTVPQKVAKAHEMYRALQEYLISNPEIFHYSSSHGWRVDRKKFFNQQATIVTV